MIFIVGDIVNNNLVNGIDNSRDPEFLIWVRNKIQENPTHYLNQNIDTLYEEYLKEKNGLQNDEGNIFSDEGNTSSKSNANARKLVNGNIHASSSPIPHNEFRGNVNWYGIVLTLIFSFAIGYLIAWILLKVR